MKIRNLVAAALLAFASTSALASPENGTYLEGNLGVNYASISIFGYTKSAFGSVAGNVNLGYKFNKYLATEVGYTNYGGPLNNLDLALKASLPLQLGDYGSSIFVKAGPAYLFTNHSHAVRPLFGIGAAYGVTEKLDVNIQSQATGDGFVTFGLLSAGLTYHFG